MNTTPTPEVLALAERWIPNPTTLYSHRDYLKDMRAKFVSEITRLMQPRAQSGGEVETSLDKLENFIQEGCSARPEDKHDSLAIIETLRAALTGGLKWRPIEEWNEDDGEAFWTKFPVDEPYYAGSPLDTDWPGYHTHWISMSVLPTTPPADGEKA